TKQHAKSGSFTTAALCFSALCASNQDSGRTSSGWGLNNHFFLVHLFRHLEKICLMSPSSMVGLKHYLLVVYLLTFLLFFHHETASPPFLAPCGIFLSQNKQNLTQHSELLV
ncbi:MAG: hypothetical protein IKY92_00325, partial [Akkermansia sp.]|nr:hypothetical protein [Akkermansia sp.]